MGLYLHLVREAQFGNVIDQIRASSHQLPKNKSGDCRDAIAAVCKPGG